MGCETTKLFRATVWVGSRKCVVILRPSANSKSIRFPIVTTGLPRTIGQLRVFHENLGWKGRLFCADPGPVTKRSCPSHQSIRSKSFLPKYFGLERELLKGSTNVSQTELSPLFTLNLPFLCKHTRIISTIWAGMAHMHICCTLI